jgi:hypothetical protein
MSVSSSKIILHYNVHEPIDISDLTSSFAALSSQYRKHLLEQIRANGGKAKDAEIKLYITKIESNCILAELAGATDILGTLFSTMDYTNIFSEFVRNIDEAIRYFKALPERYNQDKEIDKIEYSKKECSDYANFLGVVAQSKSGELGLSVAEFKKETDETHIHSVFKYNSEDAYEAKKGCLLAQDILQQSGEVDHPNVLMYFQQTNTDESKGEGKTEERAIIKTITDKPLPVYIVSNLDRERVMSHKADPNMNPLKISYYVDVNVETDRNDVAKRFRVMRIIDTVSDDE